MTSERPMTWIFWYTTQRLLTSGNDQWDWFAFPFQPNAKHKVWQGSYRVQSCTDGAHPSFSWFGKLLASMPGESLAPTVCTNFCAACTTFLEARFGAETTFFVNFYNAVVVERLPSSLPERCIYSTAPGRNRHSSLSISWLCSRPTLDHVS